MLAGRRAGRTAAARAGRCRGAAEAALPRYFFQDLGFAGNVNNYYDRATATCTRCWPWRDIPITLALLYIELAAARPEAAQGVLFRAFPGSAAPAGEVVIDPFGGQTLSRGNPSRQAAAALAASAGLTGDFETRWACSCRPPDRDIIARLLLLKEIHRSADDAPVAGRVRAPGGAAAGG